MRIISGKYRGRNIDIPNNLGARPTTERAREALFNILSHRLDWAECRVLDAFAGSGAVGIEALSRGAAEVVFVEQNPKTVDVLRKNLKLIGADNATVVRSATLSFIESTDLIFDFIFMDPPYALNEKATIAERIFTLKRLSPNGIFVMEHAAHEDLSSCAGFSELRRYGGSEFSFFTNDEGENQGVAAHSEDADGAETV